MMWSESLLCEDGVLVIIQTRVSYKRIIINNYKCIQFSTEL